MSDLAVPTFAHLPKEQRHAAYVQTVGRPPLSRGGRSAVSSSDVIRSIGQTLEDYPSPKPRTPRPAAQRIVKKPEVVEQKSVLSRIGRYMTRCFCGPEI